MEIKRFKFVKICYLFTFFFIKLSQIYPRLIFQSKFDLSVQAFINWFHIRKFAHTRNTL